MGTGSAATAAAWRSWSENGLFGKAYLATTHPFRHLIVYPELMREIAPPEQHHRIRLMMEFAPHLGRTEVPDPYYGGANGFEHVLDLVEQGVDGLLNYLGYN